MSNVRIVSSLAFAVVGTVALVASADDKKPAAPAPVAAAAAPAAPAGPPMPAPAKELESFMKGFEGSWRCSTKFAAGAMGPGSPEMNVTSTVRIAKQYGGMSWHGEYSLPRSKAMPAMSGVFQVGYDPGSAQATIVTYDNMGSATMGAGPISGDTVTFTEDAYMMGAKSKLRETMTKRAPKEILHKFEVDMGKGFQTMGEDDCKK